MFESLNIESITFDVGPVCKLFMLTCTIKIIMDMTVEKSTDSVCRVYLVTHHYIISITILNSDECIVHV